MSILNFFDFTSLINLQVYKKVFNALIKKILSKPFIHTQKSSNDSFLYFYFITVIFFNIQSIKFLQHFIIAMYWIGQFNRLRHTVCDSPNSSLTTIILQDFLNFLRVQKLKQFWAASPVATVQVKVGKCQV